MVTDKQIHDLKIITTQQGDSEVWLEQRKCRITASNFHRVFTRANTIKANPTESPKALVETILGLKKTPDTKALRHGKALEPHSKRKYIHAVVKHKHKKFSSNAVGLVLLKNYPYIGASPDMEIECECCGLGLVEIKFPYSILDQQPSSDNLPYLKNRTDEYGTTLTTELAHNTAYYFQIQGQMAVTGRGYCDLFV